MTLTCIILLLLLLTINFIVFKVKKYHINYLICTTLLLLFYFILIIAIDKSNMANGFKFNIFLGVHDGISGYDEHKYFAESQVLYNRWNDGYFTQWLKNEIPLIEYTIPDSPGYGNRNFFVVFLAALRLIGLFTATELILFKLIFTVLIFSVAYDLCLKFFNKNCALIILTLFCIYPSFIQTSVLLLRDNIIILLTLILINYLLFEKRKKLSSLRSLIFLLVITIFLFYLRLYTALIIYFIAILMRVFNNNAKLFSYKDALVLVAIYISILVFLHLPIENLQILYVQDKLKLLYGSNILAPLKLFIACGKDILTTSLYFSSLFSSYLYVKVIALGGFFYMSFIPIFIYKLIILIFVDKNVKYIHLIKSTLYFCCLNALVLMSKDGFVSARLNTMWFLLFLMIIFIPTNNKLFKTKLLSKYNQ